MLAETIAQTFEVFETSKVCRNILAAGRQRRYNLKSTDIAGDGSRIG